MVTLMGITGLSYPRILLCAGLPIAAVMWIGTYFVALKVQKDTQGKEDFGEEGAQAEDYIPSPETKRATTTFLSVMALMGVYGIYAKGGASFAILVMIGAALATGLGSKLPVGKIFDAIMEVCGKLFWLYFMFLMFSPFLNFVTASGAFDALVSLINPYLTSGCKFGFTLITTLIVSSASAALQWRRR
jgi:hypothetical protein